MQIIDSIDNMKAWIARALQDGDSAGLVPTLGCLHNGHAHLLNQARENNDRVVLSIFVNPIQFRRESWEVYPRRFAEDIKIAEDCGVDVVFAPNVDEIYPDGGSIDQLFALQSGTSGVRDLMGFTVDCVGIDENMEYIRVPERLAMRMDGMLHPWHFDGVATVVSKLFNIINPTRAYFGEKDIQQLAILESMNTWLHTGIEIVRVPAVRDSDGLSSSSRLVMLDVEQRAIAVRVAELIEEFSRNTYQTANDLVESLRSEIRSIETGTIKLTIDAIECVNPSTLEPIIEFSIPAIIYVAYKIDGIRLAETRSINQSKHTPV